MFFRKELSLTVFNIEFKYLLQFVLFFFMLLGIVIRFLISNAILLRTLI